MTKNKNIKERIELAKVSSKATIRDALKAIGRGRIDAALVTNADTGIFEGLINDGDIRRALLKGYTLETTVEKVFHPKTVTAALGSSFEEISGKFSEKIRIIPILDSNGFVVDIASFDKRINIPVAEPNFVDKELLYITECILTGWVSSGKFVNRFENRFADFCEAEYAISTSSGTSALHLAMVALGIGKGDEVIVPTLTFIATANAVAYTGASPIFVDSDPETWNIDPAQVEAAITSKTRAIIPVHLYGHPADMDPILSIAERNGLDVVEDAAEAHGALYKGKKVGALGRLGIFSFYGNKIITTGEGGMIVTNDKSLARKIRTLRDHGMDQTQRYVHSILGYNYRMTNIQAALGVGQMERIENILNRKREITSIYSQYLSNVPGITVPQEAEWAKSVFWLYSILINPKEFGITRDQVMENLSKEGIETRPFFPPVHAQPIYSVPLSFPVAEMLSLQGLSLPSSINLTDNDISSISSIIIGSASAKESDSEARLAI